MPDSLTRFSPSCSIWIEVKSATQSGLALTTGHPNSPLWNELSWRLAGAKSVDVLASFVQLSGLDVIEERLFEAIRNDGRVRILVSDYLYISDAKALWRLMGCRLFACRCTDAG